MRKAPSFFMFFAFLVGVLFSLLVHGAFIKKYDNDPTSLINVGVESLEYSAISKDFQGMYVHPGVGHDGVPTYLSARDPFLIKGLWTSLEDGNGNISYRYRRILFPLFGGVFGLLSPLQTIYGLIIVSAIAVGIIAASTAYLIETYTLPKSLLLLSLTNFGVYCSLNTMTSDTLAVAFASVALIAWLRGSMTSLLFLLAAATLTKEIYVLLPLSLGLISLLNHEKLKGIKIVLAGFLPLLLWMGYVSYRVPGDPVFAARGNITFPGAGIIESASFWPALIVQPLEIVFLFGITSILAVLCVQLLKYKNREATIIAAPWLLLYLCSGSIVWDLPNNISRASAFAWMLIIFIPIIGSRSKTSPRN